MRARDVRVVRGEVAVDLFAVDLFAVDFLEVGRVAVAFFAIDRLAGDLFAVDFLAAGRVAGAFFAVDRLAGDLFAGGGVTGDPNRAPTRSGAGVGRSGPRRPLASRMRRPSASSCGCPTAVRSFGNMSFSSSFT